MPKAFRTDRFRLGVCYYPEHWPDGLWQDDFRRMREMGLSVVRMAEFAWTTMEPEEGRFTWDLWDRVMDLAHENGIEVILGTPTATPPAWLSAKYPEILNVSQTGVPYVHGQRRHYNYNSPIYQAFSERIAEKMAERYGAHPALFGWQIDNELNCELDVFYSESDQVAFRGWVQALYGTLDVLNEAWGTVFWNQTYSDWQQIRLTGHTPGASPNPHQALDEKRFISDSAIHFAKLQHDAIRRSDSSHFITTNGLFRHLDSHELTEQALDFFSFDSYPNFSSIWRDEGPEPLLERSGGMALAVVRDISPQFCVMEQQSGPGGWVNRLEQPSPKPGQMRLWTYQSIAHGADMVLYFRWRTASFGTEIYWHGINDYSNVPNRRCAEATQIGAEVANLDAVVGSRFVAEVAILRDYDNDWDGEMDSWYGPLAPKSIFAWYKVLQHRHVPTDVVYLRPDVDLSRYKVLIYPHPAILTDAAAQRLKDYVANGGAIVFACRTGYKDERGHCPMRQMPGPVADLCGITVEEFTRIGKFEKAPFVSWGTPSGEFNDVLKPTTAKVLSVYSGGHYAGKPALTQNAWGQGMAYYYGGVFTEPMVGILADQIGIVAPLANSIEVLGEVELTIRENDRGERFVFLLNYTDQEQPIHVRAATVDLLTGKAVHGRLRMPPYGVLVLRMEQ